MKKVLNVLFYMVLGLIIVFNLISIISIKFLDKGYINFFGYTYFEVQTGSMLPEIEINDVIIVKLTDEVKVDDVVTYRDGSSFVTHRLLKINDDECITKGDANNIEDTPIKKNQIIGKVVKNISKLGIVTKVLKNPITLIIMFAIGVLVIACTSFVSKKEKNYV